MAIFEVPTEVAIAAGDVNKVKRVRRTNRSYVHTYDEERVVYNTITSLKLFPSLPIQAGKLLHVDLHVPIHNNNTSWGGAYINLSVIVTGKGVDKKWFDLGTMGTNSDIRTTGKNTIHMHRQSKVLDLPAWLNLGYDPRDTYTAQFLVTASTHYGTFEVNKNCQINTDLKVSEITGETITDLPVQMKQNFMRMIVRELS